MADKRVIAYVMHEIERDAAATAIDNPQITESYVIGNIEEADIERLEEQGVVVDELAPTRRPVTAAMARGAIAGAGPEGWRAGDDDALTPPAPGVATQWLISLGGPLLADMRSSIDATGTRLEEYVPQHCYVATATIEQATACINLPFVLDLVRYGPSTTGPVVLTAGASLRGGGEPIGRVWDLWLSDTAIPSEVISRLSVYEVSIVGQGGRRIRIELLTGSGYEVEISTLPGVLSMVEHVPPRLWNDVARSLLGVTSRLAGGEVPFTGAGQVVAVADTGLMQSHPDFRGRIVDAVALGRPGDASDPHGHGTHVAGSVLADGSASDGKYRGVAPAARLYFQSLIDTKGELGGLPVSLAELFEPAYTAGARIHSNSWGTATASAYTVDSNDVDAYVANRRDMLVVIAAGNDGRSASPFNSAAGFVDWLSIGSPASCKNALTVGAARSSRTIGGISDRTYGTVWESDFPEPPISEQLVSGDPECIAAFSSRGPCDDRRMKPDVVAPGTDIISTRSDLAPIDHYWGLADNPAYAYLGGTSMACPLVAGCAALVREFYAGKHCVTPSAALLKATLICGTRWLGGTDAVADHDKRPNYHQGFGAVHLSTTLPGCGEPGLQLQFLDTWLTPTLQLLESGNRFRYYMDVDNSELPLRMCMAYTDQPGRALQNDVSLMVQDPAGRKLFGNMDLPGRIQRSDVDNNVEVITVDHPAPGRWLIQVFARNLIRGPQDFAFVVTGGVSGALQRAPG